jgi:hypothetical protein
MSDFEPKNAPGQGNRQGRRAKHTTVKAADFLRENVVTAGHKKADDLGAKLGGNVPVVICTLARKTERSPRVALEPAATQVTSESACRAAASAVLASSAVVSAVQRELEWWKRVRSGPIGIGVGVVVIDAPTVPRAILYSHLLGKLVGERFSVAVPPVDRLVTYVRRHAAEGSAELAAAELLFQDAAAAGLVPAVVYVGASLVVVAGRWPSPWREGA